jgi:phosphonate dehydrogenase
MTGRSKVVVTHRAYEQVKQLLRTTCDVVSNDEVESWPAEKLRKLAADAEALMIFMPDRIDQQLLAHCPKLKIVSAALKGPDNIDIEACSRRGVWVSIAPDLLSEPTAELALTLALGLTRNVAAGDRMVRGREYKGWRPVLYGSGLAGNTVGILGMGRLGQAFVRLLAGFKSTRIIYHDPAALSPVEEAMLGIGRTTLEQLMARSDVLVVLAPLTAATLHLINAETLGKMKRGAYLVNVGRGSVVDEAAVADALASGQLAGYAADVFEIEDLSRGDRPAGIPPALLKNTQQTLFTPHLGSAVARVRLEIELSAARNILQALKGERPKDAINHPDIADTCSAGPV